MATRILMMTCWQENGMKVKGHLYFMHDVMKNVTSIFDGQHTRRARYEYAPFGSLLTTEGYMAQENKFRFSCEFSDDELGLVYYNYRHLNPADGRWTNRDPIVEQGGWNLYGFIKNHIQKNVDFLGMVSSSPLDPAFTPPPIPDRVGQSRGIKLSNSECEESCQCIRSLIIIMHGEEPWIRKNDTNVRAHWGERFLTENANKTEISDMFKKINFCSSCKLEIRACYLGSSPYLKKRLEQNTGCEVTLYEDQVKAFFPFL